MFKKKKKKRKEGSKFEFKTMNFAFKISFFPISKTWSGVIR
jgi:hypothetical protein